MQSADEGAWDFSAARELIRDFAFVAGLVLVGAAIHHQPGYLRSATAADIAKWSLLFAAFAYGAMAGLNFWRSFMRSKVPKGVWGHVAALLSTVVLTFSFQMLVFMAADFGDNTARIERASASERAAPKME